MVSQGISSSSCLHLLSNVAIARADALQWVHYGAVLCVLPAASSAYACWRVLYAGAGGATGTVSWPCHVPTSTRGKGAIVQSQPGRRQQPRQITAETLLP